MKKTGLALILMILSAGAAFAASQKEDTMLNLSVPSGLDENFMYFNISHKYYYDLKKYKQEDEDVFAPVTAGANINLGLRYMFLPGAEAVLQYNGYQQEKEAGLFYSYDFKDIYLKAKAGVSFFSLREGPGEYAGNFFYMASLQSHYILDLISFAADFGYNGYLERPGMGFGVSVKIFESMNIIYENYPAITDGCGYYAFGIKIVTNGHQFVFYAGNSTAQGTRNVMAGAPAQDSLHLGFNIQRILSF